MKKRFLKIIGAAVTAILLTATVAQVWVSAQDAEKIEPDGSTEYYLGRSIEGVWQTTVTLRDCQTGAVIAPPFRGLLTFHQGGTLSEFAGATSPALRSPGHGVWERENGPHRYQMAFAIMNFNAAGVFVGTQQIRQTIELVGGRGSQFVSDGSVAVLDPNGNTVGAACASSRATRFE